MWWGLLAILSVVSASQFSQDDIQRFKCEALPYRSVYVDSTCYFLPGGSHILAAAKTVCTQAVDRGKLAYIVNWKQLATLGLNKEHAYHVDPTSTNKGTVSSEKNAAVICQQDSHMKCPSGSPRVSSNCIQLTDPLPFEEAQAECGRRGMDVVVSHSDAINLRIISALGSEADSAWLGTRTAGGQWRNLDASTVDFYRWGQEKTDTTSKDVGDSAVVLRLTSKKNPLGYWTAVNTAESHAMICKQKADSDYIVKESPKCSEGKVMDAETLECRDIKSGGCKFGWVDIDGDCFQVVDNKEGKTFTFDEAQKKCEEKKAWLASVGTKALLEKINATDAWVGGFRRGSFFAWLEARELNIETDVLNSKYPERNCLQISSKPELEAAACTKKLKRYVCKNKKDKKPDGGTSQCPEGWTYLPSTKHCYKREFRPTDYTGPKPTNWSDWHGAELSCRRYGGHLISIGSADEHELAMKLSRRNISAIGGQHTWIGLWQNRGGRYVWTDRSDFKYKNFLPWVEKQGGTPCLALVQDAFKNPAPWQRRMGWSGATGWGGYECKWQNWQFVCEIDLPTSTVPKIAAESCDEGWSYDKETSNCYIVLEVEGNYKDARQQCAHRGAFVTSVLTEQANEFIADLVSVSGKAALLGADDMVPGKQTFKWDDGNEFVLKKWSSFKKFNTTATCVMMDIVGKWYTIDCGTVVNAVVCRKARTVLESDATPKSTCKDGWTAIENDCFKIINNGDLVSFDDAQRKCEAEDAWLASMGKKSTLEKLSPKDAWVGGFRRGSYFSWIEASEVTFETQVSNSANPGNNCLMVNIKKQLEATTCHRKLKSFVCKKKKNGGDPSEEGKCPKGWTYLEATSNCYKREFQPFDYNGMKPTNFSDWHGAELSCQRYGGHLISIGTEEEQQLALKMVRDTQKTVIGETTVAGGEDTWIGLWATRAGRMVWTDRIDFSYNKFMPGRGETSAPCVALVQDKNGWGGYECRWQNWQYICELDPSSTTVPKTAKTPCGDGWEYDDLSTNCYKVLVVEGNYKDGRQQCAHRGAFVTSVMDEHENIFIAELVASTGKEALIGADTLYPAKKTLKWDDGNVMEYTNWQSNFKVVNFNGTCVVMNLLGKWSTVDCDKVVGAVVCRKPRDVLAVDAVPQIGCKIGWTSVDGDCYKVMNNEKRITFDEAQIKCEEEQSWLAPMGKKSILQKVAPKDDAWVGGYRRGSLFAWLDSSATAFEPALIGTSDPSNNCLMVSAKQELIAVNCNKGIKSFICSSKRSKEDFTMSNKCPEGWTFLSSTASCYKREWRAPDYTGFNTSYFSDWHAAELSCIRQGGHLASIHSAEENQLAINMTRLNRVTVGGEHVWIGLWTARGAPFKWTDKSFAYYNNFFPTLDVPRSWSPCVALVQDAVDDKNSGWIKEIGGVGRTGWSVYDCKWQNWQYLCKSNPPAVMAPQFITADCGGDGWKLDEVTSNCYTVMQVNGNYKDMRQQCANGGAYVTSIMSEAENDIVADLVRAAGMEAYLGADDIKPRKKTFMWDDGNDIVFNNWQTSYSSVSSNGTCVMMNTSGKWYTTDCDKVANAVVCRKARRILGTDGW